MNRIFRVGMTLSLLLVACLPILVWLQVEATAPPNLAALKSSESPLPTRRWVSMPAPTAHGALPSAQMTPQQEAMYAVAAAGQLGRICCEIPLDAPELDGSDSGWACVDDGDTGIFGDELGAKNDGAMDALYAALELSGMSDAARAIVEGWLDDAQQEAEQAQEVGDAIENEKMLMDEQIEDNEWVLEQLRGMTPNGE